MRCLGLLRHHQEQILSSIVDFQRFRLAFYRADSNSARRMAQQRPQAQALLLPLLVQSQRQTLHSTCLEDPRGDTRSVDRVLIGIYACVCVRL